MCVCVYLIFFFFFFSSRRRHTRSLRDWSSDVCSSDLPILLIYAPNWNWILAANVLLGINQGLTWSSTVVMKIDLVGEKDRGFAMGLNEFAGYLAVAVVAFATGMVASEFGLRPYPFYIGIVLSIAGLLSSW